MHSRDVPAKISTDTVVVQHALDSADSADSDILIPDLAVGEFHDILLSDLADHTLDILRAEAAASGDGLAANVFSDSGGSVEREEDGGLELGLGALNFSGADVEAKARPLAESEVNQVIEAGQILRDKVDTPEAMSCQ